MDLRPKSRLLLLASLWALVVVCGFARSAHAAPPATTERVTLQLKWKHQFQFAGYYVALDKGYYREAGLDVVIREAVEGTDSTKEVVEGRAEFGVGTTELLLDRAKGAPVVVLAVIFQHSPLALAVAKDRGVEHVHNLRGRRAMIEPGSAELYALFRREKLPQDALTILPHQFQAKSLVDGTVDAMSVYVTDEPYDLNRSGFGYSLLSAREAGIDFYGDNLFTTETQLREHAARTAAFRAASLRGWREAVTHPTEAVDLIVAKYGNRKSRDHLLFEADKTISLIMPGVVEIGYMYPGRWRHIADTYAEVGMLPGNVALEGFLYEPNPVHHTPAWVWWALGIGGAFLLIVMSFSASLMRARRSLEQSERRMRMLIEAAPIPMVVTSLRDHRIVFINDRACAALSVSSDVAIGSPASLYFVTPQDREKLVRNLGDVGKVVVKEFQLRPAGGEPFWAIGSARLLEFQGKQAVVTGFVDLTERKKLENDLHTAIREIRTLRGILPICAHCKKIRTEQGAWQRIEQYISARSDAHFSHSVCPECSKKHFPDDDTSK